jgi:hypothetical protein
MTSTFLQMEDDLNLFCKWKMYDLYDLYDLYDAQKIFPVKDVIKQLSKSLQNIQQVEIECRNKPSLRTSITFKDFNN